MNLYAAIKIIHAIENRLYDFSLPWAASYEEIYQAIDDIKAQIVQMEANDKARKAEAAAAAQPSGDSVPQS